HGVPGRRPALPDADAQPDRGRADHGRGPAGLLVRRPPAELPAVGGAARPVRLPLLCPALRRLHPGPCPHGGRGLLSRGRRDHADPERRLPGVAPLRMDRSLRSGLILLAGLALLAAALAVQAILLETIAWTVILAAAGAVLVVVGVVGLRVELGAMVRRRRGEIALSTLGVVGVLLALAYLSVRYPFRFDLTPEGVYSLSA